VIIASFNSRETISACLSSLERQSGGTRLETIMVDSSTDGTADRVRRDFPWVRLETRTARQYAGDARNIAMGLARADVVAFLDADCTVEPEWAEEVLAAHSNPHLLVGGVICNGSRAGLLGWGYYFLEFSLWLPGPGPPEIDEIAGCCLSMKREAYDRYGPFLGGTYSSDTAFQWRLRDDGHRVLREPRIRVHHFARMSLASYLRHVVHHRRDFARVLCRCKGLSTTARLLRAALSMVLPLPLLGVTASRVIRSRANLGRFCAALPVILAGALARAAGELAGFVSPPPGRLDDDRRAD